MSQQWQKVIIKDNQGKQHQAIAPVVISASRRTDIPAFYGKWLMDALERGYCKWQNPFNKQSQFIAFEKVRAIVLWTKNPKPFFPYLDTLIKKNINFYFQFTLNNYEHEKFEPAIPLLKKRINIFRDLSEKIGRHRVIWRYDPLILTRQITVDALILRIKNIGNQLHEYTKKLVFSFADIDKYRKVKANFNHLEIPYQNFSENEIIAFAQKLSAVNKKWNLQLSSCAEEFDLSHYGINHNKCIDDELLIREFSNDKLLMNFLGANQQSLFSSSTSMKDKSQRKACKCIFSKDIGTYNTCHHHCVYCYANTSRKTLNSEV